MRIFLVLTLLALPAAAEKKVIVPPGSPASASPLSAAIQTSDMVYVSGMTGATPQNRGNVEQQTRTTLDRVGAALKAAGVDFENVVSTNVWVADIRMLAECDRVYREVFGANPPARTVLEANLMANDVIVEISAVAVRDASRKRILRPEGWMPPAGPMSYAVAAGDTIYVSGMPPVDMRTGRLAGEDIASQLNQAMKNVEECVKLGGASLNDLVTVRNFIADGATFGDMNAAYRKHFTVAPPARATMLAFPLQPDHLIQIQAVAVKGSGANRPAPAAGAVLSGSIRAGNTLYISGMTGRGPSGTPKNDIKAQTKFTLDRVAVELEKNGMSFGDIVDSMVWLRDPRHFQAMNEVYRSMVKPDPPARATVRIPAVAAENLIEIMMIAVK